MVTRGSQRPFNVPYYARHRAQEIERVRVRQAATLQFLRDLRRVPCADCGGRFEPYQMDFDHRDPSQKHFSVMTGRAMLMSRDRLRAEVEKCDIVCANCHAIRSASHAGQRGESQRASRPETPRSASARGHAVKRRASFSHYATARAPIVIGTFRQWSWSSIIEMRPRSDSASPTRGAVVPRES